MSNRWPFYHSPPVEMTPPPLCGLVDPAATGTVVAPEPRRTAPSLLVPLVPLVVVVPPAAQAMGHKAPSFPGINSNVVIGGYSWGSKLLLAHYYYYYYYYYHCHYYFLLLLMLFL